ncbi:ATP-binding cassette domain-containing protein [Clavibacter tessellarius]|uniref:ATP-binding cassette domain-containing protein n=1 Tax=Clavibacter tessellarius TaxID=31965 RepID=UPI0032536866
MTTAAVEEHVSVRDLAKSYGTTEALRGVTFDIHRGETFALLGPNGAGKSTTIEILEVPAPHGRIRDRARRGSRDRRPRLARPHRHGAPVEPRRAAP